MNKETRSVINFLETDKICFKEYIDKCKEEGTLHLLSYSDLLIVTKLSGTTREGVDFRSSKVRRSQVTEYIKERFDSEKE